MARVQKKGRGYARKPVKRRGQTGRSGRHEPSLPVLALPRFVSTYNRTAALKFARDFWTIVCPDLHIGVTTSPGVKKVPTGTVFERVSTSDGVTEVAKHPNGTTIPFSELNDCAHFVSCCLGEPPGHTAGGLAIPSEFSDAYGLVGANRLFVHLTTEGLIEIVDKEGLTEAQAATKLSALKSGDLICYRPKTQAAYRHVGLFLNDSKKSIACHTYCRADVDAAHPLSQAWNSVAFASDVTLFTLARVL